MNKINFNNRLVHLSIIVVCILAIYIHLGPRLNLYDCLKYFEAALSFNKDCAFTNQNTFSGRLTFLPLSIGIKLFGTNLYAVTIPGLVISLAIAYSIYLNIKNRTIGLIIAMASVISLTFIEMTIEPNADVYTLGFQIFSLHLMHKFSLNRKSVYLIFSALCILMALLFKLSAVYAFAILIIYCFHLKVNKLQAITLLSILLIFIAVSGLYYQFFFDDPLFRFNVIQREHNVSSYSYYDKSWIAIIKRITIVPFMIFGERLEFSILFAFFISLIVKLKKELLNNFWILSCTLAIILHWFGSTSFTAYNPLPPITRMWLVPMFLLAISVGVNYKKIDFRVSSIVLVLVAIISINHVSVGRTLLAIFVAIGLFLFRKNLRQVRIASLSFLPVISLIGSFNLLNNKYYSFSDGLEWLALNEGNKAKMIVIEKGRNITRKETLSQFYKFQLKKCGSVEKNKETFYVINVKHEAPEMSILPADDESISVKIFENKYITISKFN